MERSQRLKELLKEKILVLDGAMGTALQSAGLSAQDFGGEAFEGCNEVLNLTRPDVVEAIHRGYLEAGADIIETNTFGSTALVLAEYPPLNEKAYEITRRGAEIARRVADQYSTPEKPRFVAGAMGPTTKAISVTGGVSFEELVETFAEQARGLIDGGVDYLLIETAQDTRNVKAALIGCQRAMDALGVSMPIAVSGTIEPMGTMLAGQDVEAFVVSLEHVDLLYIGLNCATGPQLMADHIRAMHELAAFPVACVPNAGLPDQEGRYLETPEMMAAVLERFIAEGWLNLIGGCCGTTAAHIRAFARLAEGAKPRIPPRRRGTFVSGIEVLEISDEKRPVIVGERTNVIGSRQFRELVAAGKYEEASEIARRQVKSGAQVIDICLADPDRDELADMEKFLQHVVRKVKVPLMIDSTDPKVIERALTYSQGKAIINSINLEEGEERFRQVVPLARKYGAALVVGCIDEHKEQGMALTRERKLEIALRSYDLLVNKYGVPPSDLIFDPLVFPCATGDQQYLGSALETIEGIRLIKQALPECKTILGISNVSFGLPPAGREVLNSVFLYHATQAGLDMAIVNAERLERYASIPQEERELAEKLLFETTEEAIQRFVAHFRGARRQKEGPARELSLDERLARYIIEGSKDGLIEDLELKLKEATPLEIINGPLMAGMDEVGRLFNNNELIVAEVLQSAEAMKAAVAYLEPLMEKEKSQSRGKVILATVKGDVHDIGKNLVGIILANNGFEVIDLGIKVPPAELIRAIQEHHPDIVGLSGLLVKSAQQMVVTAQELAAAGTCPPMLVGGAALSNGFTRRKIAPAYGNLVAYAEDAMKGLELALRIVDPEQRERLIQELQQEDQRLLRKADRQRSGAAASMRRSSRVPVLDEVPQPPDFDRHVLRHINLDEVWAYINPAMLYSRHLGLRGGRAEELLARKDPKALKLKELVDELKAVCRAGAMEVHAVWQFFPAYSEGNTLYLLDQDQRELASLEFPRQPGADGLCLADYANPREAKARDNVCLFAVTAGKGIRELYQEYRDAGEYLKSHAIQALAIETAEACAEWLHSKIRAFWGFPDDPRMTMKDRFQARYRGRRYSFGYPACPDLALQKTLFELLRPEEIGISLTEDWMMDPEASVSAVVFHHPACEYFDASKEGM
ncbi:MAG TPA: methionine synthase [Limnochordia bacterium]|nr:methionine synthase [Limnochordia bacterium]